MNIRVHLFPTVITFAMAATAQATTLPPSMPSPGSYRVDSVSTFTSRSPTGELVVTHTIDGASGQLTVTTRSSSEPNNVSTRVLAGKPDIRCMPKPTAPPAQMTGHACKNSTHQFGDKQSTLQANCNGVGVGLRWTRIDDRTWDTVVNISNLMAVNASSPNAAIEFAASQMPPAERAKLLARVKSELPTDAQRAQALRDARAAMEANARKEDPQTAAAMRKSFDAATGAGPASGAGMMPVERKERWVRVAETCSGTP